MVGHLRSQPGGAGTGHADQDRLLGTQGERFGELPGRRDLAAGGQPARLSDQQPEQGRVVNRRDGP